MGEKHDGSILLQIIEDQGVSKTNLATKLGVDRGTLYRYFDRDYLQNDLLIRIGKALRVDMTAYYDKLKMDPGAQQVQVFNEDPAAYIKKVSELERKVDVFNSKSYNWMEETINSYKELLEAKDEIIQNLKVQLNECRENLNSAQA